MNKLWSRLVGLVSLLPFIFFLIRLNRDQASTKPVSEPDFGTVFLAILVLAWLFFSLLNKGLMIAGIEDSVPLVFTAVAVWVVMSVAIFFYEAAYGSEPSTSDWAWASLVISWPLIDLINLGYLIFNVRKN